MRSGNPASTALGTFGAAVLRVACVTTRPRKRPESTCGLSASTVSNAMGISFASRALTTGAPPRYGTWTTSRLASFLNSSPTRWKTVPMPADPKLATRTPRIPEGALRAEPVAETLREQPADDVRSPARRIGHDKPDRAIRISVRQPGPGANQQDQGNQATCSSDHGALQGACRSRLFNMAYGIPKQGSCRGNTDEGSSGNHENRPNDRT